MLATDYQAVDVLMLVGNLVPVSVYFLILGLVNSHARPYLVTSRSDFSSLTVVLVPVLLWPIPTLVQMKLWGLLLAGLCIAAALFIYMLPKRHAGFVIYNTPFNDAMRLLTEALRELGRQGSWHDRTWQSEDGDVTIDVRTFALLRNVSFHIEAEAQTASQLVPHLGATLERRLASVSQLPSAMGACLVMLGLTLLTVPMWMAGRHIRDLVDAVSVLLN